ncbi:MAG: hypothetical protein HC841_06975 [Verrucomicrobiae bacterium]|nr:hypothetical protein [Verrucomicrobiae bacterium]
MVKDQNGDLDPLLWDTIDIVVGTTFAETWSYWEIPGFPEFNGYGGPDSALDGSQITLLPNQPVVVNRLASAGATNACVLGQVQVKPFTHYLDEGATAVTMVFAASQQVALSKLAEAPNFAPDVDGDQTPSDSVIVSEVNGTVFTPVMSFFEIPGFPELDGWFDGVNTQSTEELDPTKGYIISVPFGNGTIRWRQPAPYSL